MSTQAIKVLEALANKFDASLGICWDMFDFWIDRICPIPDSYAAAEE